MPSKFLKIFSATRRHFSFRIFSILLICMVRLIRIVLRFDQIECASFNEQTVPVTLTPFFGLIFFYTIGLIVFPNFFVPDDEQKSLGKNKAVQKNINIKNGVFVVDEMKCLPPSVLQDESGTNEDAVFTWVLLLCDK